LRKAILWPQSAFTQISREHAIAMMVNFENWDAGGPVLPPSFEMRFAVFGEVEGAGQPLLMPRWIRCHIVDGPLGDVILVGKREIDLGVFEIDLERRRWKWSFPVRWD